MQIMSVEGCLWHGSRSHAIQNEKEYNQFIQREREKEIKKTLLENQREEEEAMILSNHQRVILPNNG